MHSRVKSLWAPNQHTDGSHVINIGTFGSHDSPEAFFLRCTVGFVQVSFSVTVHHTPFTVQHTETVPVRSSVFQKAARTGEQVSWPLAGSRGSTDYRNCSQQQPVQSLSLSGGASRHLPGDGYCMLLGHLRRREGPVLSEAHMD